MASPNSPTETLTETVASLVRAGNDLEKAAAYVDVEPARLQAWLIRGRTQKHGSFRDFVDALARARAQVDMVDAGVIAAAAKDDWRAAQARIETRRARDREAHLERLKALTT